MLLALKGFAARHVSATIGSALRWAALGLVVLVALSLHTRWKQRGARKRMQAACANVDNRTIFVALLGEHSTLNTAQALYSVFEHAACPSRVRVGLYEVVDDADGSALDVYTRMAEKNGASGMSFASQVSVLQRFAADRGPLGALQELFMHALRDEAFVLTLSDATQVLKGWDKKMLELVERAGRTCLVVTPATNPSFGVLSDFEDGLPVLGLRNLSSFANTPAKFWQRECSFAPADFWKQRGKELQSEALRHLDAGLEVLVTCDAMARGWKFLHPAKHALAQPLPSSFRSCWGSSRASRAASADARLAFTRYSEPLRALGMLGDIRKEPLLGIVSAADEDEIVTKYGSNADYQYLASKL